MKEKKIIISFSGGLDSTYLAHTALEAGHSVALQRVKILNNHNKTLMEERATQKIYEVLQSKYCGKVQMPPANCFEVRTGSNLHLSQIPILLTSLLYAETDRVHECWIGYVMEDHALSYLSDIQKVWNSYKGLTHWLPPLKFPIIKKTKFEMASELDAELRQWIVYCEQPKLVIDDNDFFESCGGTGYRGCASCERYIRQNIGNLGHAIMVHPLKDFGNQLQGYSEPMKVSDVNPQLVMHTLLDEAANQYETSKQWQDEEYYDTKENEAVNYQLKNGETH